MSSLDLMGYFSSHFSCIKDIGAAGFTSEQRGMSKEVIQKAFLATEEGFLSIVRKQFLIKPQLAAVGSCCLVGVICSGTLYIANAGDSRAVLGRFERGIREVNAVQLSAEHNACHETVRDELRSLHPGDSKIVVLKHQVWRVKGIIQVRIGRLLILCIISYLIAMSFILYCIISYTKYFVGNASGIIHLTRTSQGLIISI